MNLMGLNLLADKTPKDLWNEIFGYISITIWVLVGILAVVLVIKGVSTALAVVKAADEPQLRQEKISAFKYLGIGLGIALIIATLAGTLMTIYKEPLGEAIGILPKTTQGGE